MTLTVAIPTYNRNETLRANLGHLLPQLERHAARVRLLILDNASPTPVEETLRPLLARYTTVPVEIVRHRANVGANANITRCIEVCQTPWVWVLGDDDVVRPDAVEVILRHMEEHPDCILLNFSTDGVRRETLVTRGLRELAKKLDTSADLPWISSSVYKTDALRAQLKFGYQYLYSMVPHVVMVLMAVHEAGQDGACCFSREGIVDNSTRNDIPHEQQWSLVNLALGYPVLLELPFEPRTREKLVDKLLLTRQGDGIKLRFLMYQLLLMATKHGDSRTALYLFDQVCSRRYYFETHWRPRAKRFVCRLMLRYPAVASALYGAVKRQRLGGQGQKLQDRYGRM